MARKGYVGVVDQAVVSVGNFITCVLLGRFAAPEEYGLFVIVWTTIMIALAIQNALICTPMSVIGIQRKENTSYWGSMLLAQVFLCIGICIVIITAGMMVYGVSPASFTVSSHFSLIAAATFSCLSLLGQEFFRRLLIINLNLKDTLFTDLVASTIRLGGLFSLYFMGILDTVSSLFIIGFGSLVGALLVYNRSHMTIRLRREGLWLDITESWRFGRWVMAEMLPYVLSVQGYIYLTAFIIGARETAALGASQNILNATNILILSLTNIVTPVASKKYADGGSTALSNLMIKAGILSAVPILGFYSITMIFSEEILVLVYKQNYAGYGVLLVICCVYYIFSYFNRLLQIVLYARKKPNVGFFAKSASLFFMAILAYPLISNHGVYGAAFGTIISQIVIFIGYVLYLAGAGKSENNS